MKDHFTERAKKHMDWYRREVLHIQTAGTYNHRGEVYPHGHILPFEEREKNILESIRQAFWSEAGQGTGKGGKYIVGPRFPRGAVTPNISLHRYFHHLNSSQAMCFNLFYPFLRDPARINLLAQILLKHTGEMVEAAEFEHIECNKEGTNFDFFMQLQSGRKIFFECKFTEERFGPADDDEKHRNKHKGIYKELLEGKVQPEVLTSHKLFFTHYQLFRNIAFLHPSNKLHRLFIIYPEAHSHLKDPPSPGSLAAPLPTATPAAELHLSPGITAVRTWVRLVGELQDYAFGDEVSVVLADFLKAKSLKLEDVYSDQGPSGWTCLKRAAGFLSGSPEPEEPYFGRRFSALLHIDDPSQLALISQATQPDCTIAGLSYEQRLRLQMLTYQIDGQHSQTGSGLHLLQRLADNPHSRQELTELAAILSSRTAIKATPIPGLPEVPLCLHAAYGIREILTAVGWLTATQRTPFQAGVLALPDRRVELLFVTLDKSEGFHEEIAYEDYAVSADRFHWQSQNAAGPDTESGKRYLQSPKNEWTFQLFLRVRKAEPYRACGPVTIVEATGSKPMSITWKLEIPLPTFLHAAFKVPRTSDSPPSTATSYRPTLEIRPFTSSANPREGFFCGDEPRQPIASPKTQIPPATPQHTDPPRGNTSHCSVPSLDTVKPVARPNAHEGFFCGD